MANTGEGYFIDRAGANLDATLKKVDGMEAGAQANRIETVSVNGVSMPVSGKNVNITVPKVVYITNEMINGLE